MDWICFMLKTYHIDPSIAIYLFAEENLLILIFNRNNCQFFTIPYLGLSIISLHGWESFTDLNN